MTHSVDIEQHPDIRSMRAQYEVAAEHPIAQVVDGLTLLGGVFLAASPWIVGFTGLRTITVNDLITGFAVAALALGFSSAFGRTHGIAWVLPVLGIWTIITPWVISGHAMTARTVWTNVVVGALILVLGVVTTRSSLPRRSGGRRR
jgi:SPW repeat